MSLNLNARLDEQVLSVQAAVGVLLTSTLGDCIYVSLKNYRKVRVIIDILNGSTVTGSTITLKQATDVTNSQSDEKALAFTRMLANTDVAAAQTMVETAVASNTFTTSTTNGKLLRYIIDVDSSSLDLANGFDCFRVDGTGAANTLASSVTYDLYGARYNTAAALTN
jgi:hypothetical protein